MKRVVVIGAGQIGSRHMQALKKYRTPLSIDVVEPNESSEQTARDRWTAIDASPAHRIRFFRAIPQLPDPGLRYNLAIVATNSEHRRAATEVLLTQFPVTDLVLEKILFAEPVDGTALLESVRQSGTRAWVNCCMRQMPVYRDIRREIAGQRFELNVSGSCFGLVTTAIHYVDFFAWATGETQIAVDASALDATPIPSKRAGYWEMTGTLRFSSPNGSHGSVTCFAAGSVPVKFAVNCARARFCVSQAKLWTARAGDDWRVREMAATIPLQSDLTTDLAAGLLDRGTCELPGLAESVEIHRKLLDPILARLGRNYPFT